MGWTSQYFTTIIIEGNTPNTGIFFYSGAPANGNLIGSWTAAAGSDAFGNSYPAGINVFQGQLSGVSINNAQLLSSILTTCSLLSPTITSPTITGGTILETNITFDPSGGRLLIYSTTVTTSTFVTPGDFSWTAPANVSSTKVEVWAAGAGAGGGNATHGGETGGGGEYAQEPNYSVVAGQQYFGIVGAGGQGGITGQAGQSGGSSYFDNSNVFANGGTAGLNLIGGAGGTGSTNTIHKNGGNGANAGTSTGGSSGANSGGPNGAGNNGIQATTTSGAAAPVAQAGAGQGGAGGNNAANGSNGGAPGGSGGACGAGSSLNTKTISYRANSSRSWYGADGGTPNLTRITNGTMYQGGETASGGSFNGTQKSACLFDTAKIQADWAGNTMTSGQFLINNQHSWYNSGMSVQVKEWPASLGATSLPSSWNGLGAPLITTTFVAQTATMVVNFGATIATHFANGTDSGIAIGPGPNAFNLNYYGYFYGTPGNNNSPQLVLTGTFGGGSQTAGSGANGQVVLTYQATQTLIVSLAGQAGTDAFSNAYPAGLGISQPSGQYVKVSGASTDRTSVTCTTVAQTVMTTAWSIPANDAALGTIYRLVTWGSGTQGSTQQQLNSNLYLNGTGGTNIDNTNMNAGTIPASQNFHWRYQAEVVVTATGAGGTATVTGFFTWSQAIATTNANAATGSLSDTGRAINTTVANTLSLAFNWGAVVGAPTITSFGSYLERLGP